MVACGTSGAERSPAPAVSEAPAVATTAGAEGAEEPAEGASARATAAAEPSRDCQSGTSPVPYVLYLSRNDGPMMLQRESGLDVPDACHFVEWNGNVAAFLAELVRRECFGRGPEAGPWLARSTAESFTGVVRTADEVRVLVDQVSGGIPSGAQDVSVQLVVLPDLGVSVIDCGRVIDLGRYDGPMPP